MNRKNIKEFFKAGLGLAIICAPTVIASLTARWTITKLFEHMASNRK